MNQWWLQYRRIYASLDELLMETCGYIAVNFESNTSIFTQENEFENSACKFVAILPLSQCEKILQIVHVLSVRKRKDGKRDPPLWRSSFFSWSVGRNWRYRRCIKCYVTPALFSSHLNTKKMSLYIITIEQYHPTYIICGRIHLKWELRGKNWLQCVMLLAKIKNSLKFTDWLHSGKSYNTKFQPVNDKIWLRKPMAQWLISALQSTWWMHSIRMILIDV